MTFKIYAVGAMLKAGGYRSGSNYLGTCSVASNGQMNSVSPFVKRPQASPGALARRDSLPFDLSSVWNEGPPWLSESEGASVGGKYLIIACGFFCTREMELSLALRRHISIDDESKRVTWNLPCSKTDPVRLVSHVRGIASAGGDVGKPCAFHALQIHCRRLDERFKD